MRPWCGVGEAYAASYAELCAGTVDAVVAAVGPGHGGRALDVGSGTGDLAAVLRERGWEAVGCEPEETMRDVSMRRHPDVTVFAGGLPALPFENRRFAVVTANFVLNHVTDPPMSAAEMSRVASAGGTLVATIWTRSPSWFWLEVCERAELRPATGERLPADKDFERSVEGFGQMLSDAGWEHPEVHEVSWTWSPEPSTLWKSAEGGVASAGAFFLGLDDADRMAFRQAFDEVCAHRAENGRVPLSHTAAVAVATVI